MLAREDSRADLPKLLAIQVVGGNEHLVPVEKAQVNAFAIRGRRAGSPAVQAMDALERRFQNHLAPELFSRRTVQANQIPGLLFLHRGDEVDPVAQDNGRGMPLARYGNLPDQVLGQAPFHRSIRLVYRPVPQSSAPGRPVGRPCRTMQKERRHDRKKKLLHSVKLKVREGLASQKPPAGPFTPWKLRGPSGSQPRRRRRDAERWTAAKSRDCPRR